MARNRNLYNFLISKGFKLSEQNSSKYFDDYIDIFTNDSLSFRCTGSKSFESVDIRNILEGEGWYDLALVKFLLSGETNLNIVIPVQEYDKFLIEQFYQINELFRTENYFDTKTKLEELQSKRAAQMFPGAIK